MGYRIVIWGIGKTLSDNIKLIDLDDVVCFIDSFSNQSHCYGKPLHSSFNLLPDEYDYLVISTNKYFDEISKKCIFEYKVPIKRILKLDYFLNCVNSKKLDMKYLYAKRRLNEYFGNITIEYGIDWMRECGTYTLSLDRLFNRNGELFELDIKRKDMSLYQVTHRMFNPVIEEGYIPLGAGTGCDIGYLSSNTGDNTDKYNGIINECSALYWMWKNCKSDYIGLNHYRRVFESQINKGWPMQIEEISSIMDTADVLTVSPYFTGSDSIRYRLSTDVCQEAFISSEKVIELIFSNKSIEEQRAFNTIMDGNMIYPCNMFIMKRELLNEYCTWLFDIILSMVKEIDVKEYWDATSKRIIGYWAERLFTVWLLISCKRVVDVPMIFIKD